MKHTATLQTHIQFGALFLLSVVLVISQGASAALKTNSAKASRLNQPQDDPIPQQYLPLIVKRDYPRGIAGVELQSVDSVGRFGEMMDAGVAWLRSNSNAIEWDVLEPSEGNIQWDNRKLKYMEAEWAAAAENNVQMIQIVRGTPGWARSNAQSTCGPIARSKFEAFAHFMQQMVEKYSRAPYKVKYWEIWNEPDKNIELGNLVFGCWGDVSDPYYGGRYYGEMLRTIAPRIKSADPDAKIVIGGLLMGCDPRITRPPGKDCTISKFFEGIIIGGGADSFDVVNFHAYDNWQDPQAIGHYQDRENWGATWNTTGPSLEAKVFFLREVMARYGINKPLMNTESSILCYCDGDSLNPSTWRWDENRYPNWPDTRALYLAQVNAMALANGLIANVWYGVDGWPGHLTFLIVPGINGATTRAYQAYKTSARFLSGKVFTRVVTQYAGIKGYQFSGVNNQKVSVLWSLDGSARSIVFPKTVTFVYDLYGNNINAMGRVTLTNKPIYVESIE